MEPINNLTNLEGVPADWANRSDVASAVAAAAVDSTTLHETSEEATERSFERLLVERNRRQALLGRSSHSSVHRSLLGVAEKNIAWRLGGGIAIATLGIAVIAVAITTFVRLPETATRTYATTTGERTTITLSDRSRIVLAPHSRLTITDQFGRRNRTVALEGAAQFEVDARANIPFVVRTGAVTTRVLGTTFGVRRYATDRTTSVIVTEGRVMTDGIRTHALLSAGMIGVIGDSTTEITHVDNTADYTEWTKGRLVFVKTPLSSLLSELGRWYGYEFRLADSTRAHTRVTAEFRSDAFKETLSGLKTVLDMTITVDGKIVTLHPKSHDAPIDRSRHRLSNTTEVGK